MIYIYTAPDLGKKCYSCVRFCPTKAIEVHSGQANILEDFCISCGLCVTMCSQGAKKIYSQEEDVITLLGPEKKNRCFAMLAPSFPAAFLHINPERIVQAVRVLGFDGVFEVAFGADLVSYHYYTRFRVLVKDESDSFLISSPCPSVVFFIEKLHPELTPYLADIASPMEAMTRVIRKKVDSESKIVFIGPCSAKKEEALRSHTVDAVLTYAELMSLFEKKGLQPLEMKPSDVDLRVRFNPSRRVVVEPAEEEIRKVLAMTKKNRQEDELNCGACGYPSCREKAIAVYRGIAEVEMCLPYLISKVEKTVEDLRKNQSRLIQAEKLASMGEAMSAGGTISIKTEGEKNGFSVMIADTGPGIAEENLSKLFSPFFTTKPVGKGTGLGLPVSYGIVKMHGGSIDVQNRAEGGCSFTTRIKSYLEPAVRTSVEP